MEAAINLRHPRLASTSSSSPFSRPRRSRAGRGGVLLHPQPQRDGKTRTGVIIHHGEVKVINFQNGANEPSAILSLQPQRELGWCSSRLCQVFFGRHEARPGA
ncbi:hypothetical protein E2C01_078169 [Portunus trituberculatus]|uniref:Uncharacterized protein n=1 Tax=Portunus trituberculatus TaxID=210409 RepID=A0A5B7IS01_PORTR|nr:hypothetical protein [Portunus trituberculatus]